MSKKGAKQAYLSIPEGIDLDDREQVEAIAEKLVKELEKQGVKFAKA